MRDFPSLKMGAKLSHWYEPERINSQKQVKYRPRPTVNIDRGDMTSASVQCQWYTVSRKRVGFGHQVRADFSTHTAHEDGHGAHRQ